MPKATIAVIEGRVGGGGSELALSCDLRFAAIGQAVFNQPEVALGILPGRVRHGAPRRGCIGRSRALEVVLGCDDVDADAGRTLGLGQPGAAARRAVAVRRPAGAPHRRLPAPRRPARPRRRCCGPSKEIEADLLAEAAAFNRTLGDPEAQDGDAALPRDRRSDARRRAAASGAAGRARGPFDHDASGRGKRPRRGPARLGRSGAEATPSHQRRLTGFETSLKKSLPLSSTTMKAGKS